MKFLAIAVMLLLTIFALTADASPAKFIFPPGFDKKVAGIQKRAAPQYYSSSSSYYSSSP